MRRLQEALGRQGELQHVAALSEGNTGDPLSVLDGILRRHGITLEEEALFRVAWALLGVPAAGQLRLGEARWSRLTHLSELHDVTLPSRAQALARQLASEAYLVGDLLQARPWLREAGESKAEDVLAAIFQSEWTGFLALMGEFGPWVYAPTVSDLQALSRLYARLVHSAAESRDAEVLNAALGTESPGESLLVRLEVTDYRHSDRTQVSPAPNDPRRLIDAEQDFWRAAEDQAQVQRMNWADRRGSSRGKTSG